ncbi:MAG: hypothetical protein GQ545_03555 [Candidatus Aminicenantes bacterium]|nr:hypothetical protein [Candidatus Aminicenantes bacterium]
MDRKTLSLLAVILVLCFFCSCSSHPEEALLKRYFAALSLNDNTTLSTMALEPIDISAESWEIINVSEEVVEPFKLLDMNKNELDFKKQLEDHVGVTLDARDEWDNVVYEEERARTRAAKRAAKAKADELKVKYDEVLGEHKEMQKNYNEAKAAAAKEEEIATFSLGTGELPTIRDFTGEVFKKEVDVKTEGETGVNNYRIYLRRYILRDEATGIHHRGRWIILKFENLS